MKDLRLYDSISTTYPITRQGDRRVARAIHRALGDAQRVLNVGAGTGNYEPTDRLVVAVDPSTQMILKRPPRAAAAVRAAAEDLPFGSESFDAAMAVLTVHHWRDRQRGLLEMARVAARQVIFLFDPAEVANLWVFQYWPQAKSLPSERDAVGPGDIATVLDVVDVQHVPIPIDCTDGFGGAFWGRPDAYLDPDVQQGMSFLAQLPAQVLAEGASRLADDLRSGEWDRRYGHLRKLTEFDLGYRLVASQGPRGEAALADQPGRSSMRRARFTAWSPRRS